MGRLRCDGIDVVMQEIPGEVTLAINVTECPHHCVGCHSPHLAGSYGDYVDDILEEAIQKYRGMITCVCFMGGDQHVDDLKTQCRWIRAKYPELKIALYTGSDDFPERIPELDYLKIGSYQENLGGLDSPTTNQRFYRVHGCGLYEDLTRLFHRGDHHHESAIC